MPIIKYTFTTERQVLERARPYQVFVDQDEHDNPLQTAKDAVKSYYFTRDQTLRLMSEIAVDDVGVGFHLIDRGVWV